MNFSEGQPKHKLLQEEEEIEMQMGSNQATNTEQSTQIDDKQSTISEYNKTVTVQGIASSQEMNTINDAQSQQQQQQQQQSQSDNNNNNPRNTNENTGLILTIKKLSGEPIQIQFTDELKSLNAGALKQRAFPFEFANGYSIRFIYRGRLLTDIEQLANLEFIGHPVIHAQINPPLHPIIPLAQQANLVNSSQQQQNQNNNVVNQQQPNGVGDIENQNNQFQGVIPPNQYQNLHAIAAQMMQQQQQQQQQAQQANGQQQQQNQQADGQQVYSETEGTACDFWFGFFLVLFLDYVGMFAVFCCQYPKKTKKGAILGFFVNLTLSIIFYKADDGTRERTQY